MKEYTKQWFDTLLDRALTDFDTSGLTNHAVTIGNVREFFVQEFLKSFLPDGLHVGSGQIISAKADKKSISNQIDVVIFDPRFPHFSLPGGSGLYPAEGVIATVEVKSTLSKKALKEALQNCASVMDLPLTYDADFRDRQLNLLTGQKKYTLSAAKEIFRWHHQPKTFIWSFSGMKRVKTLCNHITEWKENNPRGTIYEPNLPRVIVSGNLTGVARNQIFDFGNDVSIFRIFSSKSGYGFFASTLLHHIIERQSAIERVYSMANYVPLDLYSKEFEKEKIDNYSDIVATIQE